MNKKDLIPTLKALGQKRMEMSILDISDDLEYKRAMHRAVKLRNEYERLSLGEKELDTINALLNALDDVEMEQSRISYLAGMMDGVLILESLDLLKE